MSSRESRGSERIAAALLASVFVVLALGVVPQAALADPAVFSLLAVGDTGAPPSDPERYRTQLAVAAGMSESDRERPVQALVLLGDNFYPDGLLKSELALRVRANLVRPYCRFLEIAGPRAAEIADACAAPATGRDPIPVFALLGNHDHHLPESPTLQRTVLREFFANWRMPAGLVAVHDLPGGLLSGMVLMSPAENDFTVDATVHGEEEFGSKTTLWINGVAEVIHTSCSTPFRSGHPAPLDDPKGDPSPTWFVEAFTQK